jgi:DNA-binding CsgD family transcriptional regulator
MSAFNLFLVLFLGIQALVCLLATVPVRRATAAPVLRTAVAHVHRATATSVRRETNAPVIRATGKRLLQVAAVVAWSILLVGVFGILWAGGLADGGLADGTQIFSPGIALATAALALGDVIYLIAWGYLSSTMPLYRLYRTVIISYFLGLICYLAISLLPVQAILPAVIAVSAGSSGFLLKAAAQLSPSESEQKPSDRSWLATVVMAVKPFARTLLCTAAFAFISGLISCMPDLELLTLAAFQHIAIIASMIMVAILFVSVLLLSRSPDITGAFRIALPISAVGFLILPFAANILPGASNALINMGFLLVSIILWCMMAQAVAQTQLSARVVFGVGLGVTAVSQLLGKLIGLNLAANFEAELPFLAAIALSSFYLLSLLSLCVFKNRRPQRRRPGTDQPAPTVIISADHYSARCNELGRSLGLTTREQEVLPLLGQGRSIANIAQVLFVSENTVKSHIRSIYRKTEVHTKQELIDLLNNSDAQISGD